MLGCRISSIPMIWASRCRIQSCGGFKPILLFCVIQTHWHIRFSEINEKTYVVLWAYKVRRLTCLANHASLSFLELARASFSRFSMAFFFFWASYKTKYQSSKEHIKQTNRKMMPTHMTETSRNRVEITACVSEVFAYCVSCLWSLSVLHCRQSWSGTIHLWPAADMPGLSCHANNKTAIILEINMKQIVALM